jgi:hypothetical protein
VQDEQVRPRAGRDRVGAASVVAELDEQHLVIELLEDSADLPACKRCAGRSASNATTSKTDGLSFFAFFFAFITAPEHPVSLFAQYQHTWWSSADFYTPASPPAFNYAFRREDDTIELGVNFYFNSLPAPVSSSMFVKALPTK